jgi:hypothetical protein
MDDLRWTTTWSFSNRRGPRSPACGSEGRFVRACPRCGRVLLERKSRSKTAPPVLLQCSEHRTVRPWLVLDLTTGKVVRRHAPDRTQGCDHGRQVKGETMAPKERAIFPVRVRYGFPGGTSSPAWTGVPLSASRVYTAMRVLPGPWVRFPPASAKRSAQPVESTGATEKRSQLLPPPVRVRKGERREQG